MKSARIKTKTKSKRIKRCFSAYELIHMWAQLKTSRRLSGAPNVLVRCIGG